MGFALGDVSLASQRYRVELPICYKALCSRTFFDGRLVLAAAQGIGGKRQVTL